MQKMENNIEFAVVPKPKVVSDPAISRKLLKDGYRIIDIKPKRGREKETVFIFENTNGFIDKLNEYLNDRKEKRSEGQTDAQAD